MSKFMRRTLKALAVIIVLLGGALVWLNWQLHREVVTPLTTLNEGGTVGQALVVLSPGMSDFPEDVMTAFIGGLADNDWRIDRTTASSEATTAIGDYDMVVLVSPIYGNRVAPPLLDYVDRIGDFGGKRVVAVVTAGGDPGESEDNTRELLAGRNAEVEAIYGYAVYEPNDPEDEYDGSNTDRAIAMAHDAAVELAGKLQ